ncbi:MAG: cyclodeaminase/cyclohydrolase family protein, partial [Chloroflexota bacterium]
TPVHRVVEAVRREAARYGASIHHSELIGLIPGEALMDAAAWYLQLDDFSPDQVLENRLYAAQTGPSTGPGFLDSLAAGTPAPGGGSAAAYAGAMGAALVAMVARLTVGKKKYAEVEAQMTEIIAQAERLRRDLTSAVDEDATAFETILKAFKLPKETDKQQSARETAIQAATLTAAQVPLATAEKAVKVMALAERCAALGNLNAISDAATAAALCRASLTGAGYNVRTNVNGLADKHTGEPLLAKLDTLEAEAAKLEREVRKTLKERGGLSL